MARKKKKGNALPGVEIMFLLVLFGSFLVWAVSKCNMRKESYAVQEPVQEAINNDATAPLEGSAQNETTNSVANNQANITTTQNTANTTTATPVTNTPPPAPTPPPTVYTRLYVTMDSLNMRTGPHLDSTVIAKLPLFEEVFYLNEVTATTQQINLGPEIADEPWVRVRNRTGQIGWVYGAGVHYYKKRRYPETFE